MVLSWPEWPREVPQVFHPPTPKHPPVRSEIPGNSHKGPLESCESLSKTLSEYSLGVVPLIDERSSTCYSCYTGDIYRLVSHWFPHMTIKPTGQIVVTADIKHNIHNDICF